MPVNYADGCGGGSSAYADGYSDVFVSMIVIVVVCSGSYGCNCSGCGGGSSMSRTVVVAVT
jgi:hypothetical protein